MKVILQAKDIPPCSTVKEQNGEQEYSLFDSIRVGGSKPPTVLKSEGVMFLQAEVDGGYKAISADVELTWIATKADLRAWLNYGKDGVGGE